MSGRTNVYLVIEQRHSNQGQVIGVFLSWNQAASYRDSGNFRYIETWTLGLPEFPHGHMV